jgi:Sulfatase-modifying factor enzyme 1
MKNQSANNVLLRCQKIWNTTAGAQWGYSIPASRVTWFQSLVLATSLLAQTPTASNPEHLADQVVESIQKRAAMLSQLSDQPKLGDSDVKATKEEPYVNSLGMKFVPVPEVGVLFSIWETRVKDYQVFAEATKREWPKPDFKQTEEHPAVNVSWQDATVFCEWLTEQERKARRISTNQAYRLPTDLEWSAAVGLEKEDGDTPRARDVKVKGVYPWGTKWPPPKGAGNYGLGTEVDDFAWTAPVGSFEANRHGIYDLGGNVWEWCEDWYDEQHVGRVLRGASWHDFRFDSLLSSSRAGLNAPGRRVDCFGFRCVLAATPQTPVTKLPLQGKHSAAEPDNLTTFRKASENKSTKAEWGIGSFGFTVGTHNYIISKSGDGKRTGGGAPQRSFKIRLDTNFSLLHVEYAVYGDDLLLGCEDYDGESSGGSVIKLDGRTATIKWQQQIPVFEAGVIEDDSAYVTGFGFVGKLDLISGSYIWKYDGLYKDGHFNFFELPNIEGNAVLFREVLFKGSDEKRAKTIKVQKMSGTVISTE